MKCREFREMVVDLARGRAASPEAAAGHAASCAECAALLASEQAVTAALRRLKESVAGRSAPPRVGTALLDAFARRENRRDPTVPAVWWRWAAAAAVLLTLVAVPLWMRKPVAPPVVPPRVAPAPQAVVAVPRVVPHPVAAARRVVRKRAVRPKQAAPPVREVATRFYSLRFEEPDARVLRGPVVRVQVPRTTLVTFGLPIDYDRASEPVQADLMLDESGLARAIRFVRQQ